ncbi:MAG: hypothetical protein ACLFTD_12980, partial [Halochromatium sp.]
MELRPRHWIIALFIAGLLHAALVLALIPTPTAPDQESITLLLEIGTGGDGDPEGGDGEEAGAAGAVPASAPTAAEPASAVSAQAAPPAPRV